jgi:hypothetical protein
MPSPSSLSRRRRVIGAGRAGLQSLRPLVSLHGVGVVSDFSQAPSRLLAERLLPSMPMFVVSIDSLLRLLLHYLWCRQLHCKNVSTFSVVRSRVPSITSIRGVEFALVLVSLVYDLLEYVSKIGLFLLNRTPMIHVVTHFLSTGINLFITIVVISNKYCLSIVMYSRCLFLSLVIILMLVKIY